MITRACYAPKTTGQANYLNKLKSLKPITVVTGPAGSGKTMFACQQGILEFKERMIDKLILTRPAVSTDEDLGYLPGTFEEKLSPWMRPIFDFLHYHYSPAQIRTLLEDKRVEIAPLSYMRGRTFNNSFIIADEMQNSTENQMKMILTRIGQESKMVLTGDLKQSDLHELNGLETLTERLSRCSDLEHIDLVQLTEEDVIRSNVIKEILNIYKA